MFHNNYFPLCLSRQHNYRVSFSAFAFVLRSARSLHPARMNFKGIKVTFLVMHFLILNSKQIKCSSKRTGAAKCKIKYATLAKINLHL